MRHGEIESELSKLAFDFFYWFSRFEFALKERRFLKSDKIGNSAQPNWNMFVDRYRDAYHLTPAGKVLVEAKPKRQVVGLPDHEFVDVEFAADTDDLDKLVVYLKTVRNNLFHGGKHGEEYWDDAERTKLLLSNAIAVLHELAQFGEFSDDFTRYY
jgi:hypothetical protein